MLQAIKQIILFIRVEASGGVLLFGAAILALIACNSSFAPVYEAIVSSSLRSYVNDYGMALFFLLVGLEIKREVLEGELSSRETALLPTLCAVGGMVVPALIYFVCVRTEPGALRGWAIPTATDIAFSLGVLSLFGTSLPLGLKVFLTALAIIDDLLAILVIAIFYTEGLVAPYLFVSGILLSVLLLLNRGRVKRILPYLIVGSALAYTIHHGGIHATIAGVLTALAVPLDNTTPEIDSPLEILEHTLHPWIAYLVLPLFGFLNAGVALDGFSFATLLEPITLGSFTGLFIGKLTGVFLIGVLAVKSGIAQLPEGVSWRQFFGLSILTGIGFTMSLFIGGLAFSDIERLEMAKTGVLLGSLASMVVGGLVLVVTRDTSRTTQVKRG